MVNGSAGEGPLSFDCEQGQLLLVNYAVYTQRAARHIAHRYSALAGSAEDLAQEAFLRTAQACRQGRLERGRDLYPYLVQTARRLAIDALRASAEGPVEDRLLGSLRETREDPEQADRAALSDLREVVAPAIAGMRPTQRRKVLELQNTGVEDEAIAAELEVSRGQVAVQRNRGVAELQSMDEVRRHVRPGHVKGRQRGGGRRGE